MLQSNTFKYRNTITDDFLIKKLKIDKLGYRIRIMNKLKIDSKEYLAKLNNQNNTDLKDVRLHMKKTTVDPQECKCRVY